MSFEKIDKNTQSRVHNTISDWLAIGPSNPNFIEKAANAAGKNGLTPALTKRAGELFNKLNSVNELQNRDSSQRHEDFTLLDPDAISETLASKHLSKAASDKPQKKTYTGVKGSYENIGIPEYGVEPVSKAASDNLTSVELPDKTKHMTISQKISHYKKEIANMERSVSVHKTASDLAIDKMLKSIKTLSGKECERACRFIVNRFGDDGEKLIKIAAAATGRELPCSKTANYAILPMKEPFLSAAEAIDQNKIYKMKKNLISKMAASPGARRKEKAQQEYEKAMKEQEEAEKKKQEKAEKIREKGAKYIGSFVKGTAGAAKGSGKLLKKELLPLVSTPGKTIGQVLGNIYGPSEDSEVKESYVYYDFFNQDLRDALTNIKLRNALVDTITDEYAKTYPIPEVQRVFDQVIAGRPELIEPGNKEDLLVMVRRGLVQGMPDIATREQEAKMLETKEHTEKIRRDREIQESKENIVGK